MGTLYGIHYSPWSLRARWALDVRGVPYRYREHLPMLGEPALRARLGRWRGRVTLPAFIDGDLALGDSLDIARHADAEGEGPSLFEPPEVERWSDRFEQLAEDGRVVTTARTADDPEALLEAVPLALPTRLKRATGRFGVWHLARKYDFGRTALAERERRMRDTLEAARARRRGDYLLSDQLSFADLSLAAALQFVAPLGPPRVSLAPAYLRCWRFDSLADSFADLVAWRDALVERHPFVPR